MIALVIPYNPLVSILKEHGFDTMVYKKASYAFGAIAKPDIIIYDSSLMRSSGERAINRLSKHFGVPVIYCHNGEYGNHGHVNLEHPVSARKLLNRIKTALSQKSNKVIKLGDVSYYFEQQTIKDKDGQPERLHKKTAMLLDLFLETPNELIAREYLIETLEIKTDRSLDVHISGLRKKVKSNRKHCIWLQTIRGQGYIFWIKGQK